MTTLTEFPSIVFHAGNQWQLVAEPLFIPLLEVSNSALVFIPLHVYAEK